MSTSYRDGLPEGEEPPDAVEHFGGIGRKIGILRNREKDREDGRKEEEEDRGDVGGGQAGFRSAAFVLFRRGGTAREGEGEKDRCEGRDLREIAGVAEDRAAEREIHEGDGQNADETGDEQGLFIARPRFQPQSGGEKQENAEERTREETEADVDIDVVAVIVEVQLLQSHEGESTRRGSNNIFLELISKTLSTRASGVLGE